MPNASLTLRHILLLILAPAQFVVGRLHELTGLGRSVGAMANDAPSLATPAGYAFFIWLIIFTLWSICAVYQALPSQRTNPLWQRLGWPMVITVAAGNLWMLTAILAGNGPLLVVLIAVMLTAALTALFRGVASVQTDTPTTPFIHRILLPALGLCAGWLTLASFLNLSGVVQMLTGIPTGSALGAVVTILAASIVGGVVLLSLRNQSVAAFAYGAALIWGLLAISVANAAPALSPVGLSSLLVAWVAWVCAAAVVMVLALRRPTLPLLVRL